ncbi:polysaccharide deacetylase family protein [Fictibacillus barbaricus]|uniref:Sporulation protein (Polysaccharide deacetylase family) n=1 Tax=Fictibacillus barbaricus TaxID=182136 RepID=A0ABU1TY96_9BACL|nr:polysaccharide deacetylase family protein [Fictibacillus barbaricus]MDR7072190.1 putative sporulation protein (polysaccharide deacetylase family) [Fictibacillus barbaricus]
MKKSILNWSIIVLMLTAVGLTVHNPFTSTYIESIKAQTTAVSKMESNSIYNQIKQKAKEYNRPPQNAQIDPVWKATPGYNGLVVDMDESFKAMKKENEFDEKKLVVKQIEPTVHLDNLPASPIYRGNPEKPMVTLLVNVAWGNEYLPGMLQTMKKYNVKSTFFLDGSWVKKNPSLAKMIREEGHEIGNHAYSHPDLKKMTNARITEELKQTNEVINATLDLTPKWFAPPSGSYRNDVVQIANELGMKTILWSVDTVDWRNPDPKVMTQKVLSKVHPGAMVLMHPTKSSAAGLEEIIKGIKEKGYSIGTVSSLMDEKRLLPKSVK